MANTNACIKEGASASFVGVILGVQDVIFCGGNVGKLKSNNANGDARQPSATGPGPARTPTGPGLGPFLGPEFSVACKLLQTLVSHIRHVDMAADVRPCVQYRGAQMLRRNGSTTNSATTTNSISPRAAFRVAYNSYRTNAKKNERFV